jgi:hypothetical protein
VQTRHATTIKKPVPRDAKQRPHHLFILRIPSTSFCTPMPMLASLRNVWRPLMLIGIAAAVVACSDTSAPVDQRSPSTVETGPAETAPTDQTRPTVVSKSPEPGAAGVTLGSVIRATFSEPLDPNSLIGEVMSVRSPEGDLVQGTFAYDASTYTATFTPSVSLAEFRTYTATITNDVRDLAGLHLEAPVKWSFTTVDNTRPRVYNVNPPGGNNNIQLNARATVRFTEAMDPATITTATFYVLNRDATELAQAAPARALPRVRRGGRGDSRLLTNTNAGRCAGVEQHREFVSRSNVDGLVLGCH